MDHFIERRRDEPAEPDYVDRLSLCSLQDLFGGDHYAKIDDFEIITAENDRNNTLSDVVDVTFYRRDQNFSLCPRVWATRTFRFHKRGQARNGFLHHPSALDNLRQKHLSGTKQIPDDASCQERSGDEEIRCVPDPFYG